MKTVKKEVEVQHIRVGVSKGYDKSTANKGKFVTSDAKLKKMKKEGIDYNPNEQYR